MHASTVKNVSVYNHGDPVSGLTNPVFALMTEWSGYTRH
jgi:hypothetical protein